MVKMLTICGNPFQRNAHRLLLLEQTSSKKSWRKKMLPKLNPVDLYTIKRIPKVLIFASLPIWLEVFLFEAEDVVFRGPNKRY